jgi:hypothetical protein
MNQAIPSVFGCNQHPHCGRFLFQRSQWTNYHKPGNCPECGMTLQPVYGAATGTNAPPTAAMC